MTVERTKQRWFRASRDQVAKHVQSVLHGDRRYRNTRFDPARSAFTTTVDPSFWLLPTSMTIRLEEDADGTLVTVKTTSQWYVLGDIFGFYNRFIREFLKRLEQSLNSPGYTSTPFSDVEIEADRFKDLSRQLGGAAAVFLFAGWYLYVGSIPWGWVLIAVGLVILMPALALYYL